MKRNKMFRPFITISCLILLIGSCAKDGGFYEPKIADRTFSGTTLEYLESKPGVYDSLLKVIDRLELQPYVSDSTTTLFAVTNESFSLAIENLNNVRLLAGRPEENLSNVKIEQLDTMAAQYIIRGLYPSDSLQTQDGRSVSSVRFGYPMHIGLNKSASSGYVEGGPAVMEFSDTRRSQFQRNWITTSTGSINIRTSNGVVNVVTPDHVFGFNAFVSRLTYVPPPPNLFQIIGGKDTVSRENSGGPNAVEASKYAFDGNRETKFLIGDMGTVWLQFELNEAAVANAYTITAANDFHERDPTDWSLQGSNDGENWALLDSKAGEIFNGDFDVKVMRFNNTTAYKFYRLNILRARSGGTMQMADWTVNQEER